MNFRFSCSLKRRKGFHGKTAAKKRFTRQVVARSGPWSVAARRTCRKVCLVSLWPKSFSGEDRDGWSLSR